MISVSRRQRTVRHAVNPPVARLSISKGVARIAVVLVALVAGTALVPMAAASPTDPCAAPTNPIVCENSRTGTSDEFWDSWTMDSSIEGFATDSSVQPGSPISFKVKASVPYTLDIYRLGYYNGLGARKITNVPVTARTQPACASNTTTGLYDCGTWQVSATWTPPADTVSGVFLGVLTRPDTGGINHIPFVVRNVNSTSDLIFQTSDTTWQAYNKYGGANFYPDGNGPKGRNFKLSYNRPTPTKGNDFLFAAEYPMLRFLERNGYDVSYQSGIDTDRFGSRLTQHKTFLSVGHDEYWSGNQRAKVEAARDAGVNLAFFAGNDVYWKTRYEPSIDGSATDYRTIVCYKDTWEGAQTDPTGAWTGTWRDPRFNPEGGKPENSLIGTAYQSNFTDLAVTVGAEEGKLRFWRNAGLANQAAGTSTALAPHTIGYESNEDLDNGFRPAGLFRVSETTGPTPEYLRDYGVVVTPGTTTHSMTTYRAASGALVFSAGTIQWAWGLDENHVPVSEAGADPRMQQATINILADMSAQPLTLMSGMVAASKSTDTTPPVSTITSPAAGTTFSNGQSVTVTGTATDTGGRVGGVEVSSDGGATYHRATGRGAWTYTFNATGSGPVQLKVRATDDSANIETPKTAQYTVNCPCSLFGTNTVPKTPDVGEAGDYELGVRFSPDVDGYIGGIKFYKAAANTGIHNGTLWSEDGDVLATGTFSGESSSGWQTLQFDNPVPVGADTNYVASYRTRSGHYSAHGDFFQTALKSAPLTAPRATATAPNGVFAAGGTFPRSSYQATNYFVDVIYNVSAVDVLPPVVSKITPAAGATGVPPTAVVSATLNEQAAPSSIQFTVKDANGANVPGTVAWENGSKTAKFTPNAAFAETSTFTASFRASDLAGNAMAAPRVWTFTTRGADNCPCTLFSSDVPVKADAGEAAAVELGVRFYASGNGWVTGVRFYKSAANTGTHVGSLWSGAGERLATGTFVNETATGWQTLEFAEPVRVTAGTEYVASYHAPNGHFAGDNDFFTADHVREPLTAPAGSNGLYKYGSGGFPDQSYAGTNYWVDTLFQTTAPPDLRAPAVRSSNPASGTSWVAVTAAPTVTFTEPVSTDGLQLSLTKADGTVVPGAVTYDAGTSTARFTPTANLAERTTYTVSVRAKDIAGNLMAAPATWNFSTKGGCPCSLFPSESPTRVDGGDGAPVELGVKFTPGANGWVTGVRFYKAVANTGTHTGTLWNAAGERLATGTFIAETGSGWQTLYFTTPVQVTSGTTYTASYFAPNGHYSADTGFFETVWDRDPMVAPAGNNGVFQYGGGFPAESFSSTNYWVDPMFETTLAPGDTRPPLVVGTTPVNDATRVSTTPTLSAVFDEPVNESTIQFTLRSAGNVAVAGTTTYDAATKTARFTPSTDLDESATYTASVRASDVAGNAMANARTWSFGTWSSALCPCTIQGDGTPAEVDSGDGDAVELGVKFSSDVNGFVSGVKFYKAAANTGTHTGTLWAPDGSVLATGTFAAESASGWQTLTFAAPVAITKNTVYTASYTAPVGHYSTTHGYFANDVSVAPLRVQANSSGVYRYGTGGTMPAGNTGAGTSYWVDPVFQRTATLDTTPPAVSGETPAPGATGVALTAAPAAVFSEPVSQATIQFTLRDGGGNVVPSALSYDSASRTARIVPSAALVQTATYTAALSATDTAGNAMAAPRTWTFSTGDFTAPTVTAVSPAAGATAVTTSTAPTATFSEPVTSASIQFTVADGSTPVAGTVAYNVGTRVATFTPATALPGGRTLTASARASDTAGNAMAAPSTWSFSTVDTTPPVVTAVAATGSGTTATVTWTTNEAATSRVIYGTTATNLNLTANGPAGTRTSHSVALTGLTANTRYYYRVVSADAANNSATSPATSSAAAQYAPATTPFVQNTASGFGSGTVSSTYLNPRTEGGVVLAPSGGAQEFTGTTVPTSWTSSSLATGSSVTVGSGVATVSGRFFRSTGTFGAGRELDAVATLRPVNNQWLGFTSGDYTSIANRWAAFRTTATGGLVAETRSSALSSGLTTTTLAANLVGTSRRYEIDWTSTQVVYRVDGNVVATHNAGTTTAMYVAARDVTQDANPIVIDSVWLTPYATSGTFTSNVLDAGASVNWGNLTVAATAPANTAITYDVRTGPSATAGGTGWSAWTRVAAGADIPLSGRYVQYRANLTATTTAARNSTPAVTSVTLPFTIP